MWLVPFPVLVPLGVAAILAAPGRHMPRRLADGIALSAAGFNLIACWVLLAHARIQPIVYWFGGWVPKGGVAIGIDFAVDPLGAGFGALSSALVLAGLVFSLRYFDSVGAMFHALMLVFLAALCGFALTGDLFDLFVFFELMSAAAFALCGYKSEELGPIQGALNFAVSNTVGAFLILIGIGLLYGHTGALNFAQLSRTLVAPDRVAVAALVLICSGLLVKAAAVPFHFWLPDAHAVAPTPVCILFSGVMVEAGLLGVARILGAVMSHPLHDVLPHLRAILVVLGAITAAVGGLMCFAQRHLKRMLAFSTVSHAGIMLAGVGALTGPALGGAALYVLGHGLVKSALFLCAGIVLHRYRTVDEIELIGRGRGNPRLGMMFGLGGLALAGLPPVANYFGEAKLDDALRPLGLHGATWVFAAAAVLTGGTVLRVTARIFLGVGPKQEDIPDVGGMHTENPETRPSPHTPFSMWFPPAVLLAAAFALPLLFDLRAAAEAQAHRVLDTAGLAAHVLRGAPMALELHDQPVHPPSLARAVVICALALLLATVTLGRRHLPRPIRVLGAALAAALEAIRKLHSGHIGDDIAWLTFGVAAFGTACIVLLR